MPELVWDQVGDRVYETGLDRGVLYLPDGSAVPWNGLTSIIEQFEKESEPVYFDGMKISDLIVLGAFSASMKAVTYPEEFVELEGLVPVKQGLFYTDQPPQAFGLCYRTQVGDDLEGDVVGHKIHILYNVTAIPNEKTYATTSAEPSLVEFEWTITAVPEEVVGFRPTAHIIVDSRDVDPFLLEELESILYGSQFVDAALIPMSELVQRINDFLRWEVIDNGDGTWSATTDYDDLIELGLGNYFEISGINAWYWDQENYTFMSTTGADDVSQIKIHDSGDGIWTATSDYEALIVYIDETTVDILNANTVVVDADTYQISDTPEE